jgi:hypothetical protein
VAEQAVFEPQVAGKRMLSRRASSRIFLFGGLKGKDGTPQFVES